MLVFGLACAFIDVAYINKLKRKELEKELSEKNNLKRLLKSYNHNRSKE